MERDRAERERRFGGWDAESLASRLESPDAHGKVFHVRGVHAPAILRDFSGLRRRLDESGRLTFGLDPTGAVGDGATLRDVAAEYASRVGQERHLDEESSGLVDFVASARTRSTGPHDEVVSGSVFRNAVCQLWASLSQQMPAVLFVFNARECSATERDLLEHFVSEFFADPVSEFAPELSASERVRGSLVFAGNGGSFPLDVDADLVEAVDASNEAKENIRETLTREPVVEKVLESTGGDPERVDALIDSLPSDCENFWHYRYRQLDEEEQRVLQLLALADEPVSVECLERAIEGLAESISTSSTVRALTDEGYVERRIEAGSVQFQIPDPEFRRLLVESVDEDRRSEYHRAIAEAARNAQLEGASDRFLARHYLAAGEREEGFLFGMRAARRLHGEHALGEALELFETLREYADNSSDLREIRSYLLDIYAALGDQERAVQEIEKLEEAAEDGVERARLKCKRGQLLVKAGEYESALELFDEIRSSEGSDGAGVLEARAILGEAEVDYLRGDHEPAERRAEEALEVLETSEGGETAADRVLVLVRNLLGRIELFGAGRYAEARPLFEQNLALSRERSWYDEIGRAELNLAVIDLQEGDYGAAVESLEQLRRRNPGPRGTQRAALLINLGMAAQRRGEYEEALEHYRSAVRESKRVDYDEALGAAAYNLATIFQDLGAYDRALSIIDRLERRQLAQHRHMFLGSLPEILQANVHIEKGEYLEALELLESLDLAGDGRVTDKPIAKARLRSVQAHLGLGQIDQARAILDDVEIPGDSGGSGVLEGLHASALAGIGLLEESWDEAAETAKKAGELLRRAGFYQDSVRASVLRATALKHGGRTGEAHSLVERRLSDFQQRAESIPEQFHEEFFSIPVYRELVALSRELDGDIPAPYREYVESEEETTPEVPDPEDEAFRRWRQQYSEIIGEDERLLKIFRRIDQVAESDSPVLIQGSSGTGKELIAEAIHSQAHAQQEDVPFVKVNCGAFVDNLLLSELFGHEQGAFTGAVDQKVGRFERADGGTIFLDEIGEISKKAQVALLRVLQEGEFERVGGTETKTVDVRVICATNCDLEAAVESGEFRLDLYYRLKGVLLELPPLRARKQDIPRLVRHFARTEAPDDEAPAEFDREVLEFLASYSWPGNIRELKNFVRSILLFVDGDTVDMEHLRGFRDFFSEGELELEAPNIDYDVPVGDYEVEEEPSGATFANPEEALVDEIVSDGLDLSELKKRIEYESIRRALKETGGNITRAAEILQMTRPRLSQIVNSDDGLVELKERLVG